MVENMSLSSNEGIAGTSTSFDLLTPDEYLYPVIADDFSITSLNLGSVVYKFKNATIALKD